MSFCSLAEGVRVGWEPWDEVVVIVVIGGGGGSRR